jgi:hypothetical protein
LFRGACCGRRYYSVSCGIIRFLPEG